MFRVDTSRVIVGGYTSGNSWIQETFMSPVDTVQMNTLVFYSVCSPFLRKLYFLVVQCKRYNSWVCYRNFSLVVTATKVGER